MATLDDGGDWRGGHWFDEETSCVVSNPVSCWIEARGR